MSQKAVKLGVTSLVLVLAFGGLLYSTLSEGTEYYKHVDEVMANPEAWNGKRLQLHGFVVPGSIMRKPDSLDWRFKVQNKGHVVTASYTGIVPDPFRAGRGVVVTVREAQSRGSTFIGEQDSLTTKCPSKYQAASRPS